MDQPLRLFITATNTGVGKTVLTTALALALRLRGAAVVALKPIETGCEPDPLDALALARACGRPELAHAAGLYRARLPVAPYAAALAGEAPPPALDALAATIRASATAEEHLLVEGAGGPLVPYDASQDLLDLAKAADLEVVLLARDELGVLSHTLTAAAAIRARGLRLAAVVLQGEGSGPSHVHNAQILAERLAPAPLLRFTPRALDDDALAEAAERALLPALCYRS
jgi:dethiobiotin synthetase